LATRAGELCDRCTEDAARLALEKCLDTLNKAIYDGQPRTLNGSVTRDPATRDPATLDPATLDPATVDPETLDPATVDPATVDPAARDPAARDPAARAFAARGPTARGPTACGPDTNDVVTPVRPKQQRAENGNTAAASLQPSRDPTPTPSGTQSSDLESDTSPNKTGTGATEAGITSGARSSPLLRGRDLTPPAQTLGEPCNENKRAERSPGDATLPLATGGVGETGDRDIDDVLPIRCPYIFRPDTNGDVENALTELIANALNDSLMCIVQNVAAEREKLPRENEIQGFVQDRLPKITYRTVGTQVLIELTSRTLDPIDSETIPRLTSSSAPRQDVGKKIPQSHIEQFLCKHHATYEHFVQLTGWGLIGGEGQGLSRAVSALYGRNDQLECHSICIESALAKGESLLKKAADGSQEIPFFFTPKPARSHEECEKHVNITRIDVSSTCLDLVETLLRAKSKLFALVAYDRGVQLEQEIQHASPVGSAIVVDAPTRGNEKAHHTLVTQLWHTIRDNADTEPCFENGWVAEKMDVSEFMVSMVLIPKLLDEAHGIKSHLQKREQDPTYWKKCITKTWPVAICEMQLRQQLLSPAYQNTLGEQTAIDHGWVKVALDADKLLKLARIITGKTSTKSIAARNWATLQNVRHECSKTSDDISSQTTHAPAHALWPDLESPTVEDLKTIFEQKAKSIQGIRPTMEKLEHRLIKHISTVDWPRHAYLYYAIRQGKSVQADVVAFEEKYRSLLQRHHIEFSKTSSKDMRRHFVGLQFPVLQQVMRFCTPSMIADWFRSSGDTIKCLHEVSEVLSCLVPREPYDVKTIKIALDKRGRRITLQKHATQIKLLIPVNVDAPSRDRLFWADVLKHVCGTRANVPNCWGPATCVSALRSVGVSTIMGLVNALGHRRAVPSACAHDAIANSTIAQAGTVWSRRVNTNSEPPLRVLLLCDFWGREKGGISVFNMELCRALATSPWPIDIVCAITRGDHSTQHVAATHSRKVRNGKFRVCFFGNDPDGILQALKNQFNSWTPHAIIGHDVFTGPLVSEMSKIVEPTPWCGIISHCNTHCLDLVKDHLSKDDRDPQSRVKRLNKCFEDTSATLLYVAGSANDGDIDAFARQILPAGLSHEINHHSLQRRFQSGKGHVICIGRLDDSNKGGLVDGTVGFSECILGKIGETLRSNSFEGKFSLIGVDLLRDTDRGTLAELKTKEERTNDFDAWKRRCFNGSRFQVEAKGFLNDSESLCALLSKGSLLIAPSLSETGPLVAIEAISCGTPVLVSEGCHVAKCLTDLAEELSLPILKHCVLHVSDNDAANGSEWGQRILELHHPDNIGRLTSAFKEVREAWQDWDEIIEPLWDLMARHRRENGLD